MSAAHQTSDILGERNRYRDLVEEMFSLAGVAINSHQPHDIQVKNENFYKRLFRDGTLGLGESYMDGWWECENIPEMIGRVVKANLLKKLNKNLKFIFWVLKAKLGSAGRKSKAFEIGERHYDFGNDLFQIMLDKRMVYSCGYWKSANTLDQAQENKLELICRKLGLKSGMKLLDIGCGWGSLVKYAAEKYGVEGVGITVSKEQLKLAQEFCAGLPVELRLQDYRDINEKFDRIVSVGMFEHVFHHNYRTYMKVVHEALKDDGLSLLHTIGANEPVTPREAPWINKYIFPNSELPSLKQIGEAIEGLFVMEDWNNFGTDYIKTLKAWYENFVSGWDKIKAHYDERFFRMWTFYLLMCRGLFQARFTQLWQVVLSKNGISEGYQKNVHYDFYEPYSSK